MGLFFQLIVLAALWGASFLFMRISSAEFGVVALIFIRASFAAAVLLPFIIYTKNHKALLENWATFFFIGLVSTALPYSFFAYTSLYIPAGSTSILNATTPFFTAIVAFIWTREKPTKMGVAGLFIGFSGVYVLSARGGDISLSNSLIPIASALAATLCYAYSSIFIKLKLSHLPALTVAAGSQLYAGIILLPLALLYWPKTSPSIDAWMSIIAMAVFSTALALILFFRLLQTVGVTKTISVTYLIPLFGVLWGYLFLDETISIEMMSGGALILLGVSFTTGLFRRLKPSTKTDSSR